MFARFDSLRADGRSFQFTEFLRLIRADRLDEVIPALRAVEREVAEGAHAAGFVSYEASPAFDAAAVTRPPGSGLPLLAFGIFAARIPAEPLPPPAPLPPRLSDWASSVSPTHYRHTVDTVRQLIAAGDTYQVNFTFPLKAELDGGEDELYAHLCHSQRAGYCALLRLPGVTIASASPELFFRWAGGELELRPMKGTRPRGRWIEEDDARAAELLTSEKERAENLMIVDLLRNDAGRVSEYGSVRVAPLFEVETYPTVHQLTSTIRSVTRPDTTLVDLFDALFPSGSITGAPKIRTMQIIAELESAPRGVYTGAIGFFSPGEAVFNVPIRTLVIDRESGSVEMGVGSGITYDSNADSELRECLQKAAFTHHPSRQFELLETMRWEPGTGVFLWEEHLSRLTQSARYFDIPVDPRRVDSGIADATRGAMAPLRLRLLVSRSGEVRVESRPFRRQDGLRACIADLAIDDMDPFFYHKTTWRAPYEERLARHSGYDDVILRNARNELTELTTGNLVIRKDDRSWTPPVESGLLPGILRATLLSSGEIEERVLYPDDLVSADAVFRINSVQEWTPVTIE